MPPELLGETDSTLAASSPVGILLVNLGTPEAPTTKAVRRYLREFLSDPRVVELPRCIWLPMLHGVILMRRPRQSARAYQRIWSADGSPLMVYSRRLAAGLERLLSDRYGARLQVVLAMRYGQPSIAQGLAALDAAQVRSIVVLPLYPQYSGATSGSIFDTVMRYYLGRRVVPQITYIHDYHDDPLYIEALAGCVERFWREHGRAGVLLLSFHGVPAATRRKGDPYADQCHETARLLAQRLGLADDLWQIAFQSRFGRAEWLRPYCAELLAELPTRGHTTVDVLCPGFAADCLETLGEIAIENREIFLRAGGAEYRYIPCLNAQPAHVIALAGILRRRATLTDAS